MYITMLYLLYWEIIEIILDFHIKDYYRIGGLNLRVVAFLFVKVMLKAMIYKNAQPRYNAFVVRVCFRVLRSVSLAYVSACVSRVLRVCICASHVHPCFTCVVAVRVYIRASPVYL
jgi:hypothetical protein